MRTITIHQPECLPWLGFLDKALRVDVFVLLDSVQYRKDYFQNRNRIRTATGWTWLTVPVSTKDRSRTLIREIEIVDGDGRWRRKHLAQWKTNYRTAPYADAYLPFLEELYSRPHRRLVDFNLEVISWLFRQFGVRTEVRLASEQPSHGAATELNLSLCEAAGATVYLSGIGGKDYLDETPFRRAGIRVEYQEFRHPTYTQQHEPFLPCMTALDLLFNHGPDSARILRDANEAAAGAPLEPVQEAT